MTMNFYLILVDEEEMDFGSHIDIKFNMLQIICHCFEVSIDITLANLHTLVFSRVVGSRCLVY